MSSEPGNESFFCALRPIPRILSLRRRDYASQVQIGEPSRRTTISGCSRAPDANRYGARCRCRQQATITGLSKLRELATQPAWRERQHGSIGVARKPERSGIRAAWALVAVSYICHDGAAARSESRTTRRKPLLSTLKGIRNEKRACDSVWIATWPR
jgi:hypothetical protein